MTAIPSAAENPEGLHARYHVEKVDGEPVDPRAEYFVLRVDPYGDDRVHLRACRRAVLVYADEIQGHLPGLAKDLRERYGSIPRRPESAGVRNARRALTDAIGEYVTDDAALDRLDSALVAFEGELAAGYASRDAVVVGGAMSPREAAAVRSARRQLVELIQGRRDVTLIDRPAAEVAAAEESATARLDVALAAFDGELATAYANVVGELRRTVEWLDDVEEELPGGASRISAKLPSSADSRARAIRRVLDGATPIPALASRAVDSAETSDAVAGAASRVLALADDFIRDVKSAAASALRQTARKGEVDGWRAREEAGSEADGLLDELDRRRGEIDEIMAVPGEGWHVNGPRGVFLGYGETIREALRAAFAPKSEPSP